jgi:hypothetical protein
MWDTLQVITMETNPFLHYVTFPPLLVRYWMFTSGYLEKHFIKDNAYIIEFMYYF